jgi:hypothetical protein
MAQLNGNTGHKEHFFCFIQCGLLKILTKKIQTNSRRSIHFGGKNVHAHVAQVAAFRNGFRTVVPFEWAPLRIYKTLFMGPTCMETLGIKSIIFFCFIQCGLLKILTKKIVVVPFILAGKMFHAHFVQVAVFRNGFRTVVPFEWAPLRIYKTLFMCLFVWKHWA